MSVPQITIGKHIMFRTFTEPVELSFISMEDVMAWYCAFTSCTMLDESADRVPLIT